ncbi:MAG TPA: ATP-binding domain-containing protein [Mycobacteriales bacterium]|nr:ATP-binding domain-containing protein [Mycobacteriales bacterium]
MSSFGGTNQGPIITPEDPETTLAEERRYLDYARGCLAEMLRRVRELDPQGGDPVSTEFLKAELAHRADALREVPGVPLFFGRIDRHSSGEQFHIGRRHVRNETGDVVVVDWRADVSLAFYQATATEPMDVARRRRFGHSAGALTSLEDEQLSAGDEHDVSSSAILTAEIERPRVGPMRDIVATIAPDQDDLVRAPLAQTTCIQGAPGTGKTAVGLHRAAYLLYAHRDQLRRSRVLVVGPNRAFLSYIGELLPALGEVDVQQVVVDELVAGVTVRGQDRPELARLKGDERFADVIARAIDSRLVTPTESLVIPVGSRRWRIPADELSDLMERERSTGQPYGVIRSRLPTLIAEAIRRRTESVGGSPDDRWVAKLARSAQVREFVDHHWPAVTAKALVARLLTDERSLARAADGLLDAADQRLLLDHAGPVAANRARWSRADAFLVDEVHAHIARPETYGHVVVDEAQDLSAMQCRALGRRCDTGSATVLGDVAQATAPDAVASWPETLRHLGKPDASVVALTRGYRVPQEVLDLANRLLPWLTVDVEPAVSIRHAMASLTIRPSSAVPATVVQTVQERLGQEGSIGLIADADVLADAARALRRAGIEAGKVEQGMDQRVELVPVTLCKGLEFDHVVIVEPSAIVRGHDRGLHWLYVALTRAVSSLDVIHSEELPAELAA